MMVLRKAAETAAGRLVEDRLVADGSWRTLVAASQLERPQTRDLAVLHLGLRSGSLGQDVAGSIDGPVEVFGPSVSACETAAAGLRARRVRRTWR